MKNRNDNKKLFANCRILNRCNRFFGALCLLGINEFYYPTITAGQDIQGTSIDWLEPVRKATVMLGGIKVNNGVQAFEAIGTGILIWNYVSKTGDPPLVLTAKHVIENLPAIHVRFWVGHEKTLKEDLGFAVKLQDGNKRLFVTHPNPKVDLAVFPFNPTYVAKGAKLDDTLHIVPRSAMNKYTSLALGDVVGVLGYPANLGEIGEIYRTKPLYRQGVVSWVPSADDSTLSEVLIDVPPTQEVVEAR